MPVSKLILVINEESEFMHDTMSSSQQGSLLKRLRKGEIYFYAGVWPCLGAGLSLCVAILTKLIQQLTHRN